MSIYLLSEDIKFPDPNLSEEDGLLAIGGDLSEKRLLEAYRKGIFPWFDDASPISWWSPPWRMIVNPGDVVVSHSLKQTLKKGVFEVRRDHNFSEVIKHCANTTRKGQEGTWITSEMKAAYIKLHESGYAHSFETYYKGELVGGLYGVSLGRAFFGESMFHLMSDASKVAFYHLSVFLAENEFHFIDAQIETDHLRSLGGKLVRRNDFIRMLKETLVRETLRGKW